MIASPIELEAPPAVFAARCETCDWSGPSRASSLTALGDFDRHIAGPGHGRIRLAIAEVEAASADADDE